MEVDNRAEVSTDAGPGDRAGTAALALGGPEPDCEDRHLPAFLTPREAAERLRVSVWAVYDAVKAETLPAVRVGRAIRIPRRAVVAEASTRHPTEV